MSLLGGYPDELAARLLRSLGADAGQVERGFLAEVEGYWPPAPSSEGAGEGSFSVRTSPVCEHALARAEVFAGFRHAAGEPTSLDLLLGLIWRGEALRPSALKEAGVTREKVYDEGEGLRRARSCRAGRCHWRLPPGAAYDAGPPTGVPPQREAQRRGVAPQTGAPLGASTATRTWVWSSQMNAST